MGHLHPVYQKKHLNWISWQRTIPFIGCGPLSVTVTTRIITFLVGDPYKPSFPTGILGGGHTQPIHNKPLLQTNPNPPKKSMDPKIISAIGSMRLYTNIPGT